MTPFSKYKPSNVIISVSIIEMAEHFAAYDSKVVADVLRGFIEIV